MKKGFISFLNKIIEILIYKQKQIEVANLRYRAGVNIHPSFYVSAGTFFSCAQDIAELRIAENVTARHNCNFKMYSGARLIIHPNVYFNNGCSVNALGHIEIGENTIFGEGVKVYDHNHAWQRQPDGELVIERDGFKIGTTKIGANCWIGSNVIILNNVQIGDNVIIGAGCLIYKSVPANSIVKNDAAVTISTSN